MGMDALSIIASTIAIAQAIGATYKAIQNLKGIPKAFKEVSDSLPLVLDTLNAAQKRLQNSNPDPGSVKIIEPIINSCREKANVILEIFQKIEKEKKDAGDWSVLGLYRTTVRKLGKASRVESLMQEILKSLKDLAINQIFKSVTQSQITSLEDAIDKLSNVEPSLPDTDFEDSGRVGMSQTVAAEGRGYQMVSTGGHMQNFMDSNQFNSMGGAMNFAELKTYFFGSETQQKVLTPEEFFAIEKEACLQTLTFANAEAHLHNISEAHPRTCDWFFSTAEFVRWRERVDCLDYNGVLWIKGHPGTGKSTLMKHTFIHCTSTKILDDSIIAAYFFNARGDSLEKTPFGMLRSLVHQLLEQEPYLYERFVPVFRRKQSKYGAKRWEWCEAELKKFLLVEIPNYENRPLILLVDALDECRESDVRHVVAFLEELSIAAIGTGAKVSICLSSRHYPPIDMMKRLALVLEDMGGHDDDIEKYVSAKLARGDQDVQKSILAKASGIFMWVVLIVAMLNKAYDEGNIRAMRQTLEEVPNDLDEMFKRLLEGGDASRQDTTLLLEWVLFAQRPLTPEELYFAVMAGNQRKKLSGWNKEELAIDDIRRSIVALSKGLVEIRKGDKDTVQFIHGSVNDFLLRGRRLQTLSSTADENQISASHERLANCCLASMMMDGLLAEGEAIGELKLSSHPALEYASTFFLDHLEKAESGRVAKARIWQELKDDGKMLQRFKLFHNRFNSRSCTNHASGCACRCGVDDSLLFICSCHGYEELVKSLIEDGANLNDPSGFLGTALNAAAYAGRESTVDILLDAGARMDIVTGPASLLVKGILNNDDDGFRDYIIGDFPDLLGNPLQVAVLGGQGKAALKLIERGADIHAQGGLLHDALQAAAISGSTCMVNILLEKGVRVNAQGGLFGNALQGAVIHGYEEIVNRLLDGGADPNIQGGPFGNALQAAINTGHAGIVRTLLMKGARIDLPGYPFENAFQSAVLKGDREIYHMILAMEIGRRWKIRQPTPRIEPQVLRLFLVLVSIGLEELVIEAAHA
ncbi:hypothetical protein ABW19_dt0204540 [Dactylella cylindrospora]|nr:hypothetical protein ABW19_dt0204540 [Dactylella cylindrospora]